MTRWARWAGLAGTGAAAAILLAPVAAQAQETDPRLARIETRVRTLLDSLHRTARFPGASVAFVLPDGRSGAVAVGLADREEGRALTPADRLLAGSIGKTFVSAVALQMVAEGSLRLDDPISRWLGEEPWFDRLPNAHAITVRMLMNHTSGVAEHVQDSVFRAALRGAPDRVWRPEEMVAYVLDRPALFAAGEGWSYADTNYILLGMIVERASGRSFYGLADERLLRPLGLTATSPLMGRVLPGVVPGYAEAAFDLFGVAPRTIRDGRFVFDPQFEWTGGGFVSTPTDLARWAHALYGGRVLPGGYTDTLLVSVPAATGPGERYGLGVQVKPTPLGVAHGHSGWFPGYLSEMQYFPEHRVAVAIQFNTDYGRHLGRPLRVYLAEIARIVVDESS